MLEGGPNVWAQKSVFMCLSLFKIILLIWEYFCTDQYHAHLATIHKLHADQLSCQDNVIPCSLQNRAKYVLRNFNLCSDFG